MKKISLFFTILLSSGLLLTACAGLGGEQETPNETKYGPKFSPQEHQMRTFDALWENLTTNYIYADSENVEWDALHEKYSARIGEGLTGDEFTQLMVELSGDLPAGAMIYQSRADRIEADTTTGDGSTYQGIGAFIGFQAEEEPHIVILGVIEGSPAEKAGIKPHDSIYAIDGSPVLLEEGISVVERIRGPAGSSVVLNVQTPGSPKRTIEVKRATLTSTGTLETHQIDEQSYGYILFPPLSYEGLMDDVLASMESFTTNKELKGLILDLRVAGSSRGWPLEELLALFHDGAVGEFYNSANQEQSVTVTGQDQYSSQSVPLIILVGSHTNGFPEIFAASLQANNRATVVGEATPGEIETTTSFYLPDGSRLFVETTSFRLPNGIDVGSTGVEPNVQLDAGWDDVLPNNDPVLDQAVEILGTEK
jgi:carboxyl-terminal processing protease